MAGSAAEPVQAKLSPRSLALLSGVFAMSSVHVAGGVDNRYRGFTLQSAPARTEAVPRVAVADMPPERFFDEFVAARRPCILVGPLNGARFDQWTDGYLGHKTGAVAVEVETRDSTTAPFGQGKKKRMAFTDFLKRFEAGDSTLYLTTQTLGLDLEGRAELMGAPVSALVGDFPLRPSLTGNLVPSAYNLWMGNSPDQSSSGLHHDYHDNLYILLRGRKRFRLFSPDEADKLYPRGQLECVHPNGRICYANALTRADGAPVDAEAELAADETQRLALEEVEAAEAAVQRGENGAQKRLELANRALDAAMDALLMARAADDDGEQEDSDDDEEEEEEEEAIFGNGRFGGLSEDDDQEQEKEEDGRKRPARGSDIAQNERKRPRVLARSGDAADKEDCAGAVGSANQEEEDPPGFSVIDLTRTECEKEMSAAHKAERQALAKAFPKFAETSHCVCEIQAGEMLFLPAGWFHEVRSRNDGKGSGATASGKGSGSRGNGHVAFNYWFHPPDVCEKGQFRSPYSSQFWEKEWASRGLTETEAGRGETKH